MLSLALHLCECNLFSVQAPLRPGCVQQGKASAAGARHFSSDHPEKISRYPVPYKKALPYDIVELMEEVESKVTQTLLNCDVFNF